MNKKDIDRFESKIDKSGDCWEWTRSLDISGYGVFAIKHENYKAHRISYELYKGKIPKDMLVCHSCDNRKCVNPEHLFPGTNKDNNHDMIKKGRARYPGTDKTKGESNGRAILSKDKVLEIRERWKLDKDAYSENGFCILFSSLYGVSKSQIYRIIKNQQWRNK